MGRRGKMWRWVVVMALFVPLPIFGDVASWYGEEHRGKLMANGKPFDPDKLTCATRTHPFGTRLRVTAIASGRWVEVTVTDRGPSRRYPNRVVDLSESAFAKIAPVRQGLVEVRVELVGGK